MYNTFKNIYTEYLKHIIFGGKGALFLKKKNFFPLPIKQNWPK